MHIERILGHTRMNARTICVYLEIPHARLQHCRPTCRCVNVVLHSERPLCRAAGARAVFFQARFRHTNGPQPVARTAAWRYDLSRDSTATGRLITSCQSSTHTGMSAQFCFSCRFFNLTCEVGVSTTVHNPMPSQFSICANNYLEISSSIDYMGVLDIE